MPRIGLGNLVNSPNAFRDEFFNPAPHWRVRRYLAYAKIPTDVAVATIPLYVPSRTKDVPDKPLQFVSSSELVYGVQAILNCPSIVGASNRLKVADAVANANGWTVFSASGTGKVNSDVYGANIASPWQSLTAPLGLTSNMGNNALKLFITDNTGTALGSGIQVDASPAAGTQTDISNKYKDKAYLLVYISTFQPNSASGSFTSLANADQTLITAFEEVFKGI